MVTFSKAWRYFGVQFIDASLSEADIFFPLYREEVIMTKWDKLIGKLEARRSTLVGFRDLVGLFREMDGAHGDMQDIEVLLMTSNWKLECQ